MICGHTRMPSLFNKILLTSTMFTVYAMRNYTEFTCHLVLPFIPSLFPCQGEAISCIEINFYGRKENIS